MEYLPFSLKIHDINTVCQSTMLTTKSFKLEISDQRSIFADLCSEEHGLLFWRVNDPSYVTVTHRFPGVMSRIKDPVLQEVANLYAILQGSLHRDSFEH